MYGIKPYFTCANLFEEFAATGRRKWASEVNSEERNGTADTTIYKIEVY